MASTPLQPTGTTEENQEKQLCPGCLSPNDPEANFCSQCRAPLSAYAATGPFESIFAEGHVYRKAAENPTSRIVVIGVWLIFVPVGLAGILFLTLGQGMDRLQSLPLGAFLLALSLGMIIRSTRNFLSRK